MPNGLPDQDRATGDQAGVPPAQAGATRPPLYRYVMLAIFVGLVGAMAIASPTFRDPVNLVNVLAQNSIIGIVACGMLLMIITGGFDLSVGAVGAMSAIVAAWVFINLSIPLGIVAALAVGIATGLINGLLITKVGMNPFVATLGMQVLIRGVLLIVTDGKPVYGVQSEFTWVGLGKVGPIPAPVLTLRRRRSW